MSIHWQTDQVGYDGDYIYVQLSINYWQPREEFLDELEEEATHAKEVAAQTYDNLNQDEQE